MGSNYVTAHNNHDFFREQPVESRPVTSATRKTTVTAWAKRRPSVADSVQMTRLGDLSYTYGASSKGIVAKFSPNGEHFVVILRRGNLETNTNEYSLVLFQTSEAFKSSEPRVLISLASS